MQPRLPKLKAGDYGFVPREFTGAGRVAECLPGALPLAVEAFWMLAMGLIDRLLDHPG